MNVLNPTERLRIKNEVGSRKSEVLNQATHKGWGFYLPSDTRTVSPTRGEVLNFHFFINYTSKQNLMIREEFTSQRHSDGGDIEQYMQRQITQREFDEFKKWHEVEQASLLDKYQVGYYVEHTP